MDQYPRLGESHGIYVSGDGQLVDAAIGEFHFDEFFEVAKRAFGGKCGGNGGRLVGCDGTFGIIRNGATAARFYAFDFDVAGTDVEELKFGFGGFGGFYITKVVGGFKPLNLG